MTQNQEIISTHLIILIKLQIVLKRKIEKICTFIILIIFLESIILNSEFFVENKV